MIDEKIKVELDVTQAVTNARALGAALDRAMAESAVAAEKARLAQEKLEQTQTRTTNRVHQLRMGMYQLGSALAVTGGRAGILINAFAEMGAMMLSGGPLAIGIGLITAGFTAYNLVMRDTEQKVKKVSQAFRDSVDEINRYSEATETMGGSLRREILTKQLGATRARAVFAQEELNRMSGLEEAMRGERAGLFGRVQAGTATQVERERYTILTQSIAALVERQRVMRTELEFAKQLTAEERDRLRIAEQQPTRGFTTEEIEHLNRQFVFGAAAEAERDPIFKEWDERGQQRAAMYQRLIEDPLNEIVEANARRRIEIQRQENQTSLENYETWAQAASQTFNTVLDSAIRAIEMQAAGEEEAWEIMAAQAIKSIGSQLVAMGTKFGMEGTAELISSYGASPKGWALVGIASGMTATGVAMMAGGAHWSGSIAYSSQSAAGGAGAGAGDYGAGGFGMPGQRGEVEQDERPVIINVNGPFTQDETAAMIDRGIAEARSRGLR